MLCQLEVIDYDYRIIMCNNIFHEVAMSDFRPAGRRLHEAQDRRGVPKNLEMIAVQPCSSWYSQACGIHSCRLHNKRFVALAMM